MDILEPEQLYVYLNKNGFKGAKSSEKAGEGNIDDTLRVFTDDSSIIVKQSKPFCGKISRYSAPIERLNSEAYYFELANSLKDLHPQILFHDKNNNFNNGRFRKGFRSIEYLQRRKTKYRRAGIF